MPKDTKPSIESEKAREFLAHVKTRTDQLVREGVNRQSLTARVAALEKALDEKAHASVIGQKLTELKAEIEQVAGSKTVQYIMILLNELLGTGVPPPP